jgi:hypothetical protein
MRRRRSSPHSLEELITAEKKKLKEQADGLSHGPQKYALLKKIAELDTALDLDEWLSSPSASTTEIEPRRLATRSSCFRQKESKRRA